MRESIYYIDNSEVDPDGAGAEGRYEELRGGLKSIHAGQCIVRHYSRCSLGEVERLQPLAIILSGFGTPWEQFIRIDMSHEFEFIGWFSNNCSNLGESAEDGLRSRMREFYANYPCNIAKEWCKLLVEEDMDEPSDVYLWWGGEPNRDSCYALLTLFFEVDPDNIGTPSFDEKVSKNLRAIINIAERDIDWLSSHRKYEPNILKVIFS